MLQTPQNILETFSEPHTRALSARYLQEYWLEEESWQSYWKPLQNKVFRCDATCLPNMLFNEEFALMAYMGGVVFAREDFEVLQRCMLTVGEKWFVIVENEYVQPVFTDDNGEKSVHPVLRFKFPARITWEELLSGGLLSVELFESSYKEFFVFGDSAKWGKYAANEYWDRSLNSAGTPLDIIGFRPELASVFQAHFKQSKEEQEEIWDWLPQAYKEIIKN